MPPIQTRVSHFLRLSQRRGDAYVRTISPDLSDKTQQRTGLILGVIRADAAGPAGDTLVAHLEDSLIRGLNDNLRRLPASAGQEAVFEGAMTKVNEALSRIVSEQRLAVRLDQIDGVILAQKGVDVIAAAWGRPTLLLFHPTKDNKIKVYDLLEEEPQPKKTGREPAGRGFMHLVTGRVNCGDKLFICTEDLRATLGPAELAPIISDNDPEAATAILSEVFAAKKMSGPLALFVTDATECDPETGTDEQKPAKRLSSATQRSIEKLLSTESQTRSIMSPAILPSLLKNIGGALSGGLKAAASSFNKPKDEEPAENEDLTLEEAVAAEQLRADDGEPAAAAAEDREEQQTGVVVDADEDVLGGRDIPEEIAGEDIVEPEQAGPLEIEPQAAPAPAPLPPPPGPKQPSVAWQTAVRSFRVAGSGLKNAVVWLASKEKRAGTWRNAKTGADRALNKIIGKYNDLPASSRYILLALLAIVFIFDHSLTVAGWQRQREEAVAAYDRTIVSIRQKIDSAEASLIYRDEDRARELLREAETMIAAMPDRKPDQLAVKESLAKKVQVKYEIIRREVRLGVPEVVASITTSQETPTLKRLTAAGDAVWAASDKGEVFRISLKDGATVKAGDGPAGVPAVFLSIDNSVLAGNDSGQLVLIRAGGGLTAKTVDLGDTATTITDGDIYNNRLYLLDPTHNRILRADPTGLGYGRPQFYLKDGTDVSMAVSLSIDGLVYVLLGDGSVVRLMKGTRDPFAVGRVDPAIGSPLRIRSWEGSENVYVLDGSPARLISFDKDTGDLSAQYVSEALAGATDFLVNEKEHVVLVAAGNSLLRFALPEQK